VVHDLIRRLIAEGLSIVLMPDDMSDVPLLSGQPKVMKDGRCTDPRHTDLYLWRAPALIITDEPGLQR